MASHCVLSLRDVDETISWIKEKEQLMASDDFGRDLASVQALLRKHEGLERDLAALEDKVRAECILHSVDTQRPRLQICVFHSIECSNANYVFSLLLSLGEHPGRRSRAPAADPSAECLSDPPEEGRAHH